MRRKREQPLLDAILAHPSVQDSLVFVSGGISASLQNAGRLLDDAQELATSGRLCSAQFLLVTSQEELGKAYILADFCRVHLTPSNSTLQDLGSAFYKHPVKMAYLSILEQLESGHVADLCALWDAAVRKPLPATDEEPDEPGQAWFDREFPLYADISSTSGLWLSPSNSEQKWRFEPFDPFEAPRRHLAKWKSVMESGLVSAEALVQINEATRMVDPPDVRDAIVAEAASLCDHTGVSRELLMSSPFASRPLYDLVSRR